MAYTVQQLAEISGLTPRTLRWYDKVGLLKPQRGANGYRAYTQTEVARLQQILFYREAGLELAQIGAILDDANFDGQAALGRHLATLYQRRAEVDALIATAEKTLKAMKGETTMSDTEKFEGFKRKLIEDNEKQYGKEVRERWGDDAADASNAKMMNMTEEQYRAFQKLSEELNQTLAEAVKTGDPAGKLGQKAAALHKDWLCHTWPQYNPEAHKNLAQMYVDDPRFTEYYEKIAPGAAAFLRDTVAIMVDGGA